MSCIEFLIQLISALSLLVEPLLAKNYHVIQYNSRGVGKSSGWASFTGFSEAQDLQEVVNWAIGKLSDVQSLVVVVCCLTFIQSINALRLKSISRDILMDL